MHFQKGCWVHSLVTTYDKLRIQQFLGIGRVGYLLLFCGVHAPLFWVTGLARWFWVETPHDSYSTTVR